METLGNQKTSKNEHFLYKCELCDYQCSKKYNFDRHISTSKHSMETNGNILETKTSKNEQDDIFICGKCNKSYKHRSGLWKHNKRCFTKEGQVKKNIDDKEELIMQLLKQNAKLMEIIENGTTNNSHNTTNSHNKAFNLHFFLNETCKNAMNITDFVDSIKLQLTDFMNIGEIGFVEGISKIIVNNLNSLDETIRPIHCTDQKRETFYVKDENMWEKEEDDKKKLNKMIKGIAYKNEKLMKIYKEKYPDYNNSESARSDQYSKTVIEAMDCKEESREKIIKNISKATIIGKK